MSVVQAGEYVRVIRPMTHGERHPTRRKFLFRDDLRVGDVIQITQVVEHRMYYNKPGLSVNWVTPHEIEPCPAPPPAPRRPPPPLEWALIPICGSVITLAAVNKEKIMQFDLGSIADSPIVHTSISHAIAGAAYILVGLLSLILLKRVGGLLGKVGDHRRSVAEWKLEDGIKRNNLSREMEDRREKKQEERDAACRRELAEKREREMVGIAHEISPIIRQAIESAIRPQEPYYMPAVLRASRVDTGACELDKPPTPLDTIQPGTWVRCDTDSPSGDPPFVVWDIRHGWAERTMKRGDLVVVEEAYRDGKFSYRTPPLMRLNFAHLSDVKPV